MKYIFFFLLCTTCLPWVIGQNMSENEKWAYENYYKIERMVTMRDGVKLFTSIYLPKETNQKHPILFIRTPYSCGPYGENYFTNLLIDYYYFKYLQQGYIFVFQDVRGRYMS